MPSQIEIVKRGLPDLLPRLWRFSLVLTRNSDLAPDLVQMTCLRALERADQFEPGTRLDRWCFAIMASIYRNEQRSLQVRRGQGHLDAAVALSTDTRDQLELEVSTRQVLEIAQDLPEGQRLAVLLVYVEGYSYLEAAELLQIPTGTLMSRLAAAKSSLSRHLGTFPMRRPRAVEPGE